MQIDVEGGVEALSEQARVLLTAEAGLWRALPCGGNLLVFRRDAATDSGKQGVKLSGEIEDIEDLLNTFTLIHQGRLSGALHVAAGPVLKVLFFQEGALLSAASNQDEDRLGAVLARMGRIDPSVLDAVLREARGTEPIGRELVRRGIVNSHDVYDAVTRQTREVFNSVLLLERGSFYLVKPLDPEAAPAMLRLDVQELLLDGLRQIDELKKLRSIVPDPDVTFARSSTVVPDRLEGSVATLYAAIDGTTSLSGLRRKLHMNELMATAAAAELVQRHCVVVCTESSLRRRRVTSSVQEGHPVEDIVDLYLDVLHMVGMEVGQSRRNDLGMSVALYLAANESCAAVFEDVSVAEDGSLDREQLLRNARAAPASDRCTLVEQGLNDLLYFLLFEISHDLGPETEQRLQRNIARALSRLGPKPAPR